jgi:hypothetical protein
MTDTKLEELERRIRVLESLLNLRGNPHTYQLPPGEYTQDQILAIFPELTPYTIGKRLVPPFRKERRRSDRIKLPSGERQKYWVYIIPWTQTQTQAPTSVPAEAPD